MFGEKHVGSTFQEAMADPIYMSYIMKWMVPRTFEEKAFKKQVASPRLTHARAHQK